MVSMSTLMSLAGIMSREQVQVFIKEIKCWSSDKAMRLREFSTAVVPEMIYRIFTGRIRIGLMLS